MNIKLIIAILAAVGISVAAFFSAGEEPELSPEPAAPAATSTVPAATTTPAAPTSTAGVSAGVTATAPKPVAPVVKPVAPVAEPEPTPAGYTAAEVAVHSDASSCWTIVNGNVYDVTTYIDRHPGGERNILRICGKDGSSLFEGQHGGDAKPERVLASFMIGPLRD